MIIYNINFLNENIINTDHFSNIFGRGTLLNEIILVRHIHFENNRHIDHNWYKE